MKRSRSLSHLITIVFLGLLIAFSGTTSIAQYNETFSTPNKGRMLNFIDDFTGVNWTISPWSAAGGERDAADYFNTTAAGRLECIDLDEQVFDRAGC